MLILAKELNVSLDYLMCSQKHPEEVQKRNIISKAKGVPNYVLFGVDKASILDENRNIFGWYANKDTITKEIDSILTALEKGEPTYELRYTAK